MWTFALSECAVAALAGESENLTDERKRALHAVLQVLEIPRRREIRKPTAAAVKKRLQRTREERERLVADERFRLESGAACGQMARVADEDWGPNQVS